MPDKDGLPLPAHGVLYSYGVALLDNALLEPLGAGVRRRAALRVHVHGAAAEDRSWHRKPGQSDCDVLATDVLPPKTWHAADGAKPSMAPRLMPDVGGRSGRAQNRQSIANTRVSKQDSED